MIGEQDLYKLLDERRISYNVVHHEAVFTADQALDADIPELGVFVKNLFLCDKKKRSFYLATVPLHVRTDLKALSEALGSPRLGFVKADLLPDMLGVEAGSVTPFCILNDRTCQVVQVFAKELQGQVIGCHPLANTATIYVHIDDVCGLVEEHGNRIAFV